ncbi:MAG: sugar phosphate isomerase/epimerase [Clostridia bacterium]|nr:sugar phosphate isomerase/epimerase [Clostridia bacterium]
MLYSCQTCHLASRLGIHAAVDAMLDAGYPALDISLFGNNGFMLADDWRETAKALRGKAEARGAVFNQAHAPFGGGFEHYTKNLIPTFPRVFEFCEELGVRQIVVHPLQQGRYYGRERELFDMNMDFYRSLVPLSDKHGIKIAIENMWQTHPVTYRICDDVCANPHELAAYFDTLNDPAHFTVCLDIGHVALCGREPEDAIRILGHDRLGALHVHDVDYVSDLHTIPYLGRVNWSNVISALADIGYKGEFTMESDAFLARYPNDFLPTATKFMADTTKYLAEKLEAALAERG